MKDIFATTVILILALGMAMLGIFIEEAQQTTEEALEIAGAWQEAYTELQQDNSYQQAYGGQSKQSTGSKPSYEDNPFPNSKAPVDISDDDLPF